MVIGWEADSEVSRGGRERHGGWGEEQQACICGPGRREHGSKCMLLLPGSRVGVQYSASDSLVRVFSTS